MQLRAIDTIGPFPIDEFGNRYIVSIIDMFSRFVCLYPVKDLTAETAVRDALLPHVGIFHSPSSLLSDNGTQFVNAVVTEFLRMMGTDHQRIIPYSHEQNSLAERYHKEMLRHIRALVFNRQAKTSWSTLVPLVQRIMNSIILPSIGCSPAQLIFGNAIDFNAGTFLEFERNEYTSFNLSDHMTEMLAAQASLVREAQRLLLEHERRHLLIAPPRHTTEFPADSWVLCSEAPGPLSRPPTKLDFPWRGPYRVLGHEGHLYTLRNEVTNKSLSVHVKRLKRFEYNAADLNPRDAARKDLNVYDVEKILDYKPKIYRTTKRAHIRKSRLSFLVRWLGYSSDDDLWVPWEDLRGNIVLHRFLHEQKLDFLIPTEFRRDNYDILAVDI
jgi:transposase InsO family protein